MQKFNANVGIIVILYSNNKLKRRYWIYPAVSCWRFITHYADMIATECYNEMYKPLQK